MYDERRSKVVVTVYKQLGFYQLLDPRGPRARGRLVFGSALRIFLLAVQLIVVFGLVGFFVDRVDAYTRSELFEIIVILVNCTLSSLKMYALLNNSDTIWELFEMTGVEFLRCTQRSKDIAVHLETKCGRSATITKWIARSFVVTLILWTTRPFVAKEDDRESSDGDRPIATHRRQNIINIKFPVSIAAHNDYFLVFYIMEVMIGFCIVYGSVLVDAFLMSFCWIISAQYGSVAMAFENFGHGSSESPPKVTKKTEMLSDFKSIVIDHQNVYLKMKSFYAVVRPMTLIHVFAYSCSLIMYAYVIVMIFNSRESFIVVEIMKVMMTVSSVTIEVFIYCYLFELVDGKKESVNFGLYSCNWTGMDVEFKKLLLMSMKMNSGNRLKLKATPDIVINRPFFAEVIRNCFRIVSVLIQTQSNKLLE